MWIDPEVPEDLALIADHWPDAEAMPPELLASLLEVAQEQAEAYAPELAAGAPAPERYRVAVIFQARDLREAQQRQGVSSDVIGIGDYAIRARPLSAVVKSLLRPTNPRPSFGRLKATS